MAMIVNIKVDQSLKKTVKHKSSDEIRAEVSKLTYEQLVNDRVKKIESERSLYNSEKNYSCTILLLNSCHAN